MLIIKTVLYFVFIWEWHLFLFVFICGWCGGLLFLLYASACVGLQNPTGIHRMFVKQTDQ